MNDEKSARKGVREINGEILKAAKTMAAEFGWTSDNAAVLGLFERIDDERAAKYLRDAWKTAKELPQAATPADVFRIFDAVYASDLAAGESEL